MPSLVTAGELRSRVTIKAPGGTTSPTGGTIETTPTVFASSVPASIVSAPLGEQLKAGGLSSTVSHVVRIRYLAGVKAWMTVAFEERTFQILSVVDVDERHIEHQLLCVEVA